MASTIPNIPNPLPLKIDGNLRIFNPLKFDKKVNIDNFDDMINYIFTFLYHNYPDDEKFKLIDYLKKLNRKNKFKLIKLINEDYPEYYNQNFNDMMQIDYKIAEWGNKNKLNDSLQWNNLLLELGLVTFHSLIKINVDEFLKLLSDKIEILNKTSEETYKRKYLKYKKNYLKLKK